MSLHACSSNQARHHPPPRLSLSFKHSQSRCITLPILPSRHRRAIHGFRWCPPAYQPSPIPRSHETRCGRITSSSRAEQAYAPQSPCMPDSQCDMTGITSSMKQNMLVRSIARALYVGISSYYAACLNVTQLDRCVYPHFMITSRPVIAVTMY
jgi:hypothetical protein